MNITRNTIEFQLPESLACPKPTEERSMARDDVRLLVTTGSGHVDQSYFRNLGRYLRSGDVLVVNTSATRHAAMHVDLPGGGKGVIHFSSRIRGHEFLIEVREIIGDITVRWKGGKEGMLFMLPENANIVLQERYYQKDELLDLWLADFISASKPGPYLTRYGRPIKYDKLSDQYPLEYYQTYFSFHPGSAEMPSAGRGFTKPLVAKLLKKGIRFAPVLLHTGVSSLEENESPYPEYMEVDPISASIINNAKAERKKIIAVGTTSVRAVESAVNDDGILTPFRGNTDLFIENNYRMKVVDGLLTGFHEPKASHLFMLQSLAGFDHIEHAYEFAIGSKYFWHQFGDLHLIFPEMNDKALFK